MKIRTIVCGSVLAASLFAFASCASTKNLSNLEERRNVAIQTESALGEIKGLTSYDAVYTKEKQLRIFVKTESGELSNELVSSIKKAASEASNIPESSIAVFTVSEADVDAK